MDLSSLSELERLLHETVSSRNDHLGSDWPTRQTSGVDVARDGAGEEGVGVSAEVPDLGGCFLDAPQGRHLVAPKNFHPLRRGAPAAPASSALGWAPVNLPEPHEYQSERFPTHADWARRSPRGAAFYSVRLPELAYAPFYGAWAPDVLRPLQDRLGLTSSHVRWIQEVLLNADVPLRRPFLESHVSNQLKTQLKQPILLKYLLNRVLMISSKSRPNFVLIDYPKPQYCAPAKTKSSMKFETIQHMETPPNSPGPSELLGGVDPLAIQGSLMVSWKSNLGPAQEGIHENLCPQIDPERSADSGLAATCREPISESDEEDAAPTLADIRLRHSSNSSPDSHQPYSPSNDKDFVSSPQISSFLTAGRGSRENLSYDPEKSLASPDTSLYKPSSSRTKHSSNHSVERCPLASSNMSASDDVVADVEVIDLTSDPAPKRSEEKRSAQHTQKFKIRKKSNSPSVGRGKTSRKAGTRSRSLGREKRLDKKRRRSGSRSSKREEHKRSTGSSRKRRRSRSRSSSRKLHRSRCSRTKRSRSRGVSKTSHRGQGNDRDSHKSRAKSRSKTPHIKSQVVCPAIGPTGGKFGLNQPATGIEFVGLKGETLENFVIDMLSESEVRVINLTIPVKWFILARDLKDGGSQVEIRVLVMLNSKTYSANGENFSTAFVRCLTKIAKVTELLREAVEILGRGFGRSMFHCEPSYREIFHHVRKEANKTGQMKDVLSFDDLQLVQNIRTNPVRLFFLLLRLLTDEVIHGLGKDLTGLLTAQFDLQIDALSSQELSLKKGSEKQPSSQVASVSSIKTTPSLEVPSLFSRLIAPPAELPARANISRRPSSPPRSLLAPFIRSKRPLPEAQMPPPGPRLNRGDKFTWIQQLLRSTFPESRTALMRCGQSIQIQCYDDDQLNWRLELRVTCSKSSDAYSVSQIGTDFPGTLAQLIYTALKRAHSLTDLFLARLHSLTTKTFPDMGSLIKVILGMIDNPPSFLPDRMKAVQFLLRQVPRKLLNSVLDNSPGIPFHFIFLYLDEDGLGSIFLNLWKNKLNVSVSFVDPSEHWMADTGEGAVKTTPHTAENIFASEHSSCELPSISDTPKVQNDETAPDMDTSKAETEKSISTPRHQPEQTVIRFKALLNTVFKENFTNGTEFKITYIEKAVGNICDIKLRANNPASLDPLRFRNSGPAHRFKDVFVHLIKSTFQQSENPAWLKAALQEASLKAAGEAMGCRANLGSILTALRKPMAGKDPMSSAILDWAIQINFRALFLAFRNAPWFLFYLSLSWLDEDVTRKCVDAQWRANEMFRVLRNQARPDRGEAGPEQVSNSSPTDGFAGSSGGRATHNSDTRQAEVDEDQSGAPNESRLKVDHLKAILDISLSDTELTLSYTYPNKEVRTMCLEARESPNALGPPKTIYIEASGPVDRFIDTFVALLKDAGSKGLCWLNLALCKASYRAASLVFDCSIEPKFIFAALKQPCGDARMVVSSAASDFVRKVPMLEILSVFKQEPWFLFYLTLSALCEETSIEAVEAFWRSTS